MDPTLKLGATTLSRQRAKASFYLLEQREEILRERLYMVVSTGVGGGGLASSNRENTNTSFFQY